MLTCGSRRSGSWSGAIRIARQVFVQGLQAIRVRAFEGVRLGRTMRAARSIAGGAALLARIGLDLDAARSVWADSSVIESNAILEGPGWRKAAPSVDSSLD